MTSDMKQIIVPKENAVFWMDENGLWHMSTANLNTLKL